MNENHTPEEDHAAETAPANNTAAGVLKNIWKTPDCGRFNIGVESIDP